MIEIRSSTPPKPAEPPKLADPTFIPHVTREARVFAWQYKGELNSQIVRCVRNKGHLEPVPKGLEVLGFSYSAVKVSSGEYRALCPGDWVVQKDGGTEVEVMPNEVFTRFFVAQDRTLD